MKQPDFITALQEAYQRTPCCPGISRFSAAMENGWSVSERSHVSDCDYCQKRMLYEWRLNPPGLWPLVEFVADILLDRKAMQLYIQEQPNFARLQNSRLVKSLASIVRKVKGLPEADGQNQSTQSLSSPYFKNWFAEVPAYARGVERNSGVSEEDMMSRIYDAVNRVAMASESDEFETGNNRDLRISSPDHSLAVTVSALAGEAVVVATSPLIENSGRRVLVEIVSGKGYPLGAELHLREDNVADRAVAEVRLPLPSTEQDLAQYSVVAAWA